MPRYAFLDRDGTLVPERPDEEWRGVTAVELLSGVGRALQRVQDAGYALVVVTNQYLLDEGVLTEDEYLRQTTSLTAALAAHGVGLLDVLHCPHARDVACGCRKPATGLVDEAVRRHGPVVSGSFVIGDSTADLGLAAAVGLPGFRVGPRPDVLPLGATWVGDVAGVLPHLGL